MANSGLACPPTSPSMAKTAAIRDANRQAPFAAAHLRCAPRRRAHPASLNPRTIPYITTLDCSSIACDFALQRSVSLTGQYNGRGNFQPFPCGVMAQMLMVVEVLVSERDSNTRWPMSVATSCSIRSGRRASTKQPARAGRRVIVPPSKPRPRVKTIALHPPQKPSRCCTTTLTLRAPMHLPSVRNAG